MPRLLDRDTLSQSMPTRRGIVQAPRNPIGGALQGLAQPIDQFGDLAAREVERQKEQDNALDLTRARSALQVELMREQAKYAYDKDQDYGTWRKRYDENAPIIHDNVSTLIRDPALRERFMADTTPELARIGFEIDGNARKIDLERKGQEVDLALDNALEVGTAPGASAATQKRALDDSLSSINGLVTRGVITPEAGAAKRIKFTREFAGRRAQADVHDNPAKAATWLRGGGAGPESLIKEMEGDFWETPRWDHDHLRIGFSSDTITTPDGRVLEVKPGMRVTRADAERDLKRRAGVIQGIIAENAGPAWGKLPERAKDALTSMAYHYGSLPDSVIAAVKTGDTKTIADAVRARAGDKVGGQAGAGAQRRFREAAIIEGDAANDYAGLNKPGYYDFLNGETRQTLLTNAETELARQDKERTEASEMERYAIKSSAEDDVAQIENTGKATDLTADQVNSALGPVEAAKWAERRNDAAALYAATSVMDTMSDNDIDAHLDELEPKAGDPNFKQAQKIYDKVEVRANKLKKARLEDPAASVEDHPIVRKAMEAYDPEKPETIQLLTKARLAAQDAVGIPQALRQPVTRREAYRIIAPMQKTFDLWDAELVAAAVQAKGSPAVRRQAAKEAQAKAEDQIRGIIGKVEETYGPYAQEVLAFAIAESVKDKEIGNLAARAMKKISQREPLSKADLQALDNANDTSLAAKAVSGELPAPKGSAPPAAGQPSAPRVPGRGPLPPGPKFPTPTQPAVDDLIRNPQKAKLFDQIYGPGASDQWLPQKQSSLPGSSPTGGIRG